MNWFKKKEKVCTHKEYSYKYNADNEELYVCDSCKLVGRLIGGKQIPNSFNMITGSHSYTNRTFKPLTIKEYE